MTKRSFRPRGNEPAPAYPSLSTSWIERRHVIAAIAAALALGGGLACGSGPDADDEELTDAGFNTGGAPMQPDASADSGTQDAAEPVDAGGPADAAEPTDAENLAGAPALPDGGEDR